MKQGIIDHPEPWLDRLRKEMRELRSKVNEVEQILAVLGDDGRVDPGESGEVANLLYDIGDTAKSGWQIAARLSASGYLGELKKMEEQR